jgi:hypothetical protein
MILLLQLDDEEEGATRSLEIGPLLFSGGGAKRRETVSNSLDFVSTNQFTVEKTVSLYLSSQLPEITQQHSSWNKVPPKPFLTSTASCYHRVIGFHHTY